MKLAIKLNLQNITGTQKLCFPSKRPGSGISNDVIISTGTTIRSTLWGFINGGTFRGVSLCSRRLGGLVSSHLLVYLLQVQLPQVHAGRILDEVPPQEFETFEIPTEQNRVVFVSRLKSFNRPRSNRLKTLLGTQKLLILLQGQLTLSPEIII